MDTASTVVFYGSIDSTTPNPNYLLYLFGSITNIQTIITFFCSKFLSCQFRVKMYDF